MKQLGHMKLYSLEEVTDEFIGQKKTPGRNEFDNKAEEALCAYQIGEAIKNARLKQNLTQEELSERISVQQAQISRMGRGYCISIPIMSRMLKALGITTATLALGIAGKVSLW